MVLLKQQKINLSLNFHQVEGISTTNGIDVYLTNEYFSQSFITNQQKLHKFDLTPVLGEYLSGNNIDSEYSEIRIYPNPAKDRLFIDSNSDIEKICLFNMTGQKVLELDNINTHNFSLELSDLPAASYFLQISNGAKVSISKLLIQP
jgi:hypothetical protein